MAKQYQVVGACVTDIPTSTASGEMRVTLYKGAVLSDAGVPAERIKHLLDVGLIRELGEGEEPVPPEAEAGQPKQESQAKGPNARSLKAELVDHAVAQGLDRDEVEAMTRDQLLDKYVRKSEPKPEPSGE